MTTSVIEAGFLVAALSIPKEVQTTVEDFPFQGNSLCNEKRGGQCHSFKDSCTTLCSLRILSPSFGLALYDSPVLPAPGRLYGLIHLRDLLCKVPPGVIADSLHYEQRLPGQMTFTSPEHPAITHLVGNQGQCLCRGSFHSHITYKDSHYGCLTEIGNTHTHTTIQLRVSEFCKSHD